MLLMAGCGLGESQGSNTQSKIKESHATIYTLCIFTTVYGLPTPKSRIMKAPTTPKEWSPSPDPY